MKKLIFMFAFTNAIYAMSLAQYKAKITELDAQTIWELKDIKYKDSRIWYYGDGGIQKEWSPLGACRIEIKTQCKECECDYYFKSSHPNNRFKGDFPYDNYSDGYPQSPNRFPTEGCMHVKKKRGTCSFDNHYKLCELSDDPKVVFKAYLRHAFYDPKDPCGLKEFFYTPHKDEALQNKIINPKPGEDETVETKKKEKVNDSEIKKGAL